MKKKILIVGGGHAEVPLIHSARLLGLHIITTGNRPLDKGHPYADQFVHADFSDKIAILDIATQYKVDAICSGCNDFAVLSSAYTAECLGLPGYDSYQITELLHEKDRFRYFAMTNNITCPNARGFDNVQEALDGIDEFTLPSIVKPVDLTGGKGISVVNRREDFPSIIKRAFLVSKSSRIVVEDFIVGTRHGFSAFLINKKIVFHFTDNEHYFLNPYMVSAASSPTTIDKEIELSLIEMSERMATLLSLQDGIFHVQFIVCDNKPYIIEICRRAPGDLYLKFVEHATEIDYSKWIIKSVLGEDCSDLYHQEPKAYTTRHCIMSADNGVIKDIVYDDSIKANLIDEFLWWKPGDVVDDKFTHKCGISFLSFSSQDEMLSKTEKMQELIKVIV